MRKSYLMLTLVILLICFLGILSACNNESNEPNIEDGDALFIEGVYICNECPYFDSDINFDVITFKIIFSIDGYYSMYQNGIDEDNNIGEYTDYGTYAYDTKNDIIILTDTDAGNTIQCTFVNGILILPTGNSFSIKLQVDEKDDFNYSKVNGGYSVRYYGDSETVVIPSIYNGEPVITVSIWAFFNNTGLKCITIPDSVTTIEDGAFYYCTSLERLTVTSGNDVYHSDGNCIIETITKRLILGCKTSIIPNDGSVIGIGNCAFQNCVGLSSLSIPDNIVTIEGCAFYCCTGLESITLPNGLTAIGNAFYNCTGLKSITISNSVTTIEVYSFWGCTNIESLIVASGNTKYHSNGNCIIDTTSKELILGCKTSVIPNDGSVIYIGVFAFRNCIGLTSIIIPKEVCFFRSDIFEGCDKLEIIYYTGTEAEWSELMSWSDETYYTNYNVVFNYEE